MTMPYLFLGPRKSKTSTRISDLSLKLTPEEMKELKSYASANVVKGNRHAFMSSTWINSEALFVTNVIRVKTEFVMHVFNIDLVASSSLMAEEYVAREASVNTPFCVPTDYVFSVRRVSLAAEQVSCATTFQMVSFSGSSWATSGHYPARVSPGVVPSSVEMACMRTCGDHSCAYLHLLDDLDLFLALYSTCISLEFISCAAGTDVCAPRTDVSFDTKSAPNATLIYIFS
ncbi:hypothetical protein LguiB_012944 [Lonicera macranthoides]